MPLLWTRSCLSLETVPWRQAETCWSKRCKTPSLLTLSCLSLRTLTPWRQVEIYRLRFIWKICVCMSAIIMNMCINRFFRYDNFPQDCWVFFGWILGFSTFLLKFYFIFKIMLHSQTLCLILMKMEISSNVFDNLSPALFISYTMPNLFLLSNF